MKANCAVCGKAFEKRGQAKTCGKRCSCDLRNSRARSRRKPITTKCMACGNLFRKRTCDKTCGTTCRHKYNMEQGSGCRCDLCRDRKAAERICVVCGNGFHGRSRASKTCGAECSLRWKSERFRRWAATNPEKMQRRRQEACARRSANSPRNQEYSCALCGEGFRPRNRRYKTCSKVCSAELRRQQRRLWEHAYYQSHPEIYRERTRKYKDTHQEKVWKRMRDLARKYYWADPAKARQVAKNYRESKRVAERLGLPLRLYSDMIAVGLIPSLQEQQSDVSRPRPTS